MTKLFNIDFRNWVIGGLFLFIIILFFWKPCNKDAEIRAKLEAKSKQLEEKHKQDSINFVQKEQRWEDSIHQAGINSDLQVRVIKDTESKLKASQSKVQQLTSIIRADAGPTDTLTGVLVSAEFKEACDSLPNEIDKQNAIIGELHQDNEDLVDLMNYEIVYRDSLIEDGKIYIDSLRKDFKAETALKNKYKKLAEPRGRLLGGVGLIGNELNPLSGTKINLAYQSKGGKQYQVGGLLLRGAVYYEATVLITLIK